MVKDSYKVPASIARSILDHEIALSAGGFQAKPIPIKVILFWVLSIFVMFWALTKTPIKDANLLILIMISIWWLIATAFFGKWSKTKEMQFRQVPALVGYFAPGIRRITTRTSSNPSGFHSITGINDISEDSVISWSDGTVGRAYLVVGSASVLVFSQDKIAILERVESFFRKIDVNFEMIWITTKEPQRIYRQLGNLELLNRGLQIRDPELDELMQERFDILRDYVGGSFHSIHQYVILKADGIEALRRAQAVLHNEAESSGLMIKQLTQLDKPETETMFARVYTNRD